MAVYMLLESSEESAVFIHQLRFRLKIEETQLRLMREFQESITEK